MDDFINVLMMALYVGADDQGKLVAFPLQSILQGFRSAMALGSHHKGSAKAV